MSQHNTFYRARRLIPSPLRALIGRLWVRQFQFGLTPMDLTKLSPEFSFSAAGRNWDTVFSGGIGGWMPAPNHSSGYHGLLRQWWTAYGLGSACLLVSESRDVGATFEALYPTTAMVTTDYHLDLISATAATDIVWNLYESIPANLATMKFASVICQATMEHLMDPVGVLRKLATLLEDGGHLYLHTHTPLYPYHGWPRDYLRYFPDWFLDVRLVIPEIEVLEVYCASGHAFAAYKKTPSTVTK